MPARPMIVLCILIGMFVFYFCYTHFKEKNNDFEDEYEDKNEE